MTPRNIFDALLTLLPTDARCFLGVRGVESATLTFWAGDYYMAELQAGPGCLAELWTWERKHTWTAEEVREEIESFEKYSAAVDRKRKEDPTFDPLVDRDPEIDALDEPWEPDPYKRRQQDAEGGLVDRIDYSPDRREGLLAALTYTAAHGGLFQINCSLCLDSGEQLTYMATPEDGDLFGAFIPATEERPRPTLIDGEALEDLLSRTGARQALQSFAVLCFALTGHQKAQAQAAQS